MGESSARGLLGCAPEAGLGGAAHEQRAPEGMPAAASPEMDVWRRTVRVGSTGRTRAASGCGKTRTKKVRPERPRPPDRSRRVTTSRSCRVGRTRPARRWSRTPGVREAGGTERRPDSADPGASSGPRPRGFRTAPGWRRRRRHTSRESAGAHRALQIVDQRLTETEHPWRGSRNGVSIEGFYPVDEQDRGSDLTRLPETPVFTSHSAPTSSEDWLPYSSSGQAGSRPICPGSVARPRAASSNTRSPAYECFRRCSRRSGSSRCRSSPTAGGRPLPWSSAVANPKGCSGWCWSTRCRCSRDFAGRGSCACSGPPCWVS